MGQVFHLVNLGVPQPGEGHQRHWFEPGVPMVVLPGVTLVLLADRDLRTGEYTSRIACGANRTITAEGRPAQVMFWAMPRAVEQDVFGRPKRMLLEVSHAKEPV